MNNKISVIIDLSDRNTFEFNKNFFSLLSERIGEIELIDVSKILKQKKNFEIKNQKLRVVEPKNYKDLKMYLSQNKLILMYCINNSLKYFFVNFLLARIKVKKFIVSDLGYNPEHFDYKNQNLFEKIIFFFRQRFNYYLIRFLTIINILPSIDYFFESSSFVINSINKGISLKLKKIFPFLNFSYYKNVIKINSRHYSKINNSQISEDFIVFIDGMLFDHRDTIIRNGKFDPKIRKLYHDSILKILNKLKEIYKKKVIVCLHPSNELAQKNNDYGKFDCVKFKTEEYIRKAFIVVFHESSSIIQAIMLKKRIICLDGKLLGSFINNRCELYAKPLNLKKFDVQNFYVEDDKMLVKELDDATMNYDNYINQNIVSNKSVLGIDQILEYFNNK